MKRTLTAFLLAIASVGLIASPSRSQNCNVRIYDPNGNPINVDSVCNRSSQTERFRMRTTQEPFRVRIAQRPGGVPLVYVKFNGIEYPMLVDTGASITTITPAMARDLRVRQEGSIQVSTASDRVVNFPTGRVNSVRVGNFGKRDLFVAISNNQLPIGLLGQNFFGDYDVTISRDYVEFRPRR